MAGYLLSAVLLVAGFISVSAQEEVKYVKKGGTLTVEPSPVSGKITSVTWKNWGNFVAEWMDGVVELTYYGPFKNRTTMDITTRSLEIRNMGPADSGVLSVEINNNVQSKTYNVKLIQPVSKPHVWMKLSGNAESETHSLVCEGNIEGAEPVTYSWDLGGDEWKKGGKDQTINNDETTRSVKEFSCRMKNPISEETSEPKRNPFFQKTPWMHLLGAVMRSLAILALVGAFVYFLWWNRDSLKKRICPCLNRNDENDYEDVA